MVGLSAVCRAGALVDQLFAGDRSLAKSEADQAASLRARAQGDGSGNGGHVAKKTLPAALRHLRTALQAALESDDLEIVVLEFGQLLKVVAKGMVSTT